MALILILEDEPFIALDIESVLDEAGYRQHVTLATWPKLSSGHRAVLRGRGSFS